MASIIIVSGPNEGDYYPLGHRTFVIGRGESCPIQVVDELVSRKHAQVRYDASDDRYHLLDMKSANGVFLNGRRVEEDALLEDGDIFELGHSKLMYTIEDFEDRESALMHYKVSGQRHRSTMIR
ncbi:MAG: FHA domain-containing protein [Phycisphaerales bacterium]|nr:FHA domain-containing protein [Phycisphaerales bacterium]